MLVFVENIGYKYDFLGGVRWSLVESGGGGVGGPDPKKKSFNTYLLTVNILIIFPINRVTPLVINYDILCKFGHGGHRWSARHPP